MAVLLSQNNSFCVFATHRCIPYPQAYPEQRLNFKSTPSIIETFQPIDILFSHIIIDFLKNVYTPWHINGVIRSIGPIFDTILISPRKILTCICCVCLEACTCRNALHKGQRATWGTWLSHSTMWVLEIKHRLDGKCLHHWVILLAPFLFLRQGLMYPG